VGQAEIKVATRILREWRWSLLLTDAVNSSLEARLRPSLAADGLSRRDQCHFASFRANGMILISAFLDV